MPLTHHTDRHLVRLLATDTRRTDTTPHELARSHVALGRFLAGELVEHLELEPREIRHPQGVRQGWRVADEETIALVVFMRAGLYVAEGAREVLRSASVLHVSPRRGIGLDDADLAALVELSPKTCVLVDAVVNTGASLEPVLGQLGARGLQTFVLSLVSPIPTAERLTAAWPKVQFLFARVSENQYVGKGTTDTGNRLFGTPRLGKDPAP
ncbi:uracil phosphoribosyltransferase [Nannocystis pusilla]|uniref:uracil phosphoribosyltransferase n=1 Tax=Nannocystis pusilla TaxID=889268 RepID=UPI003DA5F73A